MIYNAEAEDRQDRRKLVSLTESPLETKWYNIQVITTLQNFQ